MRRAAEGCHRDRSRDDLLLCGRMEGEFEGLDFHLLSSERVVQIWLAERLCRVEEGNLVVPRRWARLVGSIC